MGFFLESISALLTWFQETIAEDVFKYPRLPNGKVIESKTSMRLPGFMTQMLYVIFAFTLLSVFWLMFLSASSRSSIRYSFY